MNAILIVQAPDNQQPDLSQILQARFGEHTRIVIAQSCEDAMNIFNKQHPELVILDLALVNGQKATVISRMVKAATKPICVALAHEHEHEDIFLALKAGAKGYLHKETSDEQMLKHLDRIIEDKPDISPAVSYQMIGYFHNKPRLMEETILSQRECEILGMVAQGKKRTEIANELNISANTVATHIKSIYKKLEINSRSEATREAIKRGLI